MAKTNPLVVKLSDALKKSNMSHSEQVACIGALETVLRQWYRDWSTIDYAEFKREYGELATMVMDQHHEI